MRVGHYTLERQIGAGGMAEVWLAAGPRGRCVLKLPHAHLTDNADFVRMFLDEASLLAQLRHPNIAEVYELGQADGRYFLAMEYVPGFDLMTISLEHERHGELVAPELAARIVADVAGALHAAHEAKSLRGEPLHIIHRDVTPHNVLLSIDGVVKLIDFGVARASTSRHRTQAGLVKGKYPYMSPEQITGQTIDRRVDVYALGLLLYELLTNTRAIPGETESDQILNARDAKIRPIEQLRPNVPVPLRQIIGGCLHVQVEGRYPTALDVKTDLERYLALERLVVGQEDLLRLFRGVAADVGVPLDARLTEDAQPVVSAPAVVVPDSTLPPEKLDSSGLSPTLPSMRSLDGASATPTRLAPKPAQGARGVVIVALSALVVTLAALVARLGWVGPSDVAAVDAGAGDQVETFTFPEVVVAGPPPPPKMVRLTVASPVQAMLEVDGQQVGLTPLVLEVNEGVHTLTAHAKGVDASVTWTFEDGHARTWDVPAPPRQPVAPRGRGTLHLIAKPFCSFAIDGKPQGKVSEKFVEVSEGTHSVSCTFDGQSPQKRRVKVGADAQLEVRFPEAG